VKVGDLVRVAHPAAEPRSAGRGGIGIIIDGDFSQKSTPRWVIHWLAGHEMTSTGMILRESTTYGYGLEVISESR
jgi:hypothetical protein